MKMKLMKKQKEKVGLQILVLIVCSISVYGQAPSAPNVSLQSINATSIKIVWMKRHEADVVDNITIEYVYQGPCSCVGMESCQRKNISNIGDSTYIVDNLQEYSRYLFKITAYNPVGESPATEMNFTTLPSAPTGVPQQVKATMSNLTSITLQWSPVDCFERNSEITGYMIKFEQAIRNVSSSTRQFGATKLFPSMRYYFEIAGINDHGTGPFNSVNSSTSTPEDVGLLLNGQLKRNNSVITWTEIGNGSGSLFCLTNSMDCCESASESVSWYFPNGTSVSRLNTMKSVSTNLVYQGYGHSSVFLQHQRGIPPVSGIFHCDIAMDGGNEIQQLYVGIYSQPENMARLSPIAFNLTNDINISFTLNCTSKGGPVNQMLWFRDDAPLSNISSFPTLINAGKGIYYSTLSVAGRITGDYGCRITDAHNVTTASESYNIEVLQEPTDAHAVWTNNQEFFHVCWQSPTQGNSPLPTGYRITNINFLSLHYTRYRSGTTLYGVNLTNQLTNDRTIIIHTVSDTTLPSSPIRVNVSEPGVSLIHNGERIENGSTLSIEIIGENMKTLICKTSKVKCCANMAHRFGEWYYPGGTKRVPIYGANEKFYRYRNDNGEVFLHKRANNMKAETGVYCCIVPDKDENCGINQKQCVNLVLLVRTIV